MSSTRSRQEELLGLLRNPNTGNPLVAQEGALADPCTGEVFRVRNGIPVILREDDVFGWNRKQQKGYDWLSPVYDLLYRFNLWNLRQCLAEIAALLEVESGDRVLETSIGTGQQVRNLAQNGVEGQFFGNDITYGMLRRCQKNLRAWGIDAGLVQGNAEALPFQDNLFDVVFHIGSFNFFNDKLAAIREMVRVAKAGARVYIGDETEYFQKRSTVGRLFPSLDVELYQPPAFLVPDDMENLAIHNLWNGKFWMISFRVPG